MNAFKKLLMNKKYISQFEVVFIAQEEGGYTVEVPDLPGCISEGDTFEEAYENIKEAIELYLETLEERGVPLPERNVGRVIKMTINIPDIIKEPVNA